MSERLSDHNRVVRSQFGRAASTFADRTRGRFAGLGIEEFSRVQPGDRVLEVGAGTGGFLSLFEGMAGELLAVDITLPMLQRSRDRGSLKRIAADGAHLPFSSRSVDLVAAAHTLHHVAEPMAVLKEMRRVMRNEGRMMILDQVAPESFKQAIMFNELERARDPSHAVTRPPSAHRIMLRAAGLEIIDERLLEGEMRLSEWMWPTEFPADRITLVRELIERRGDEMGVTFRADGDDYIFGWQWMMLLATR